MTGNFYYTNWVQVNYYNKIKKEWRFGIAHHDEILDYEGEAVKLDDFDDEKIIELDWRNLHDEGQPEWLNLVKNK